MKLDVIEKIVVTGHTKYSGHQVNVGDMFMDNGAQVADLVLSIQPYPSKRICADLFNCILRVRSDKPKGYVDIPYRNPVVEISEDIV